MFYICCEPFFLCCVPLYMLKFALSASVIRGSDLIAKSRTTNTQCTTSLSATIDVLGLFNSYPRREPSVFPFPIDGVTLSCIEDWNAADIGPLALLATPFARSDGPSLEAGKQSLHKPPILLDFPY